MSIDVRIESLTEEIEDAFRRLLPNQMETGPDLIRWKFLEGPAGPGELSVARINDKIVGVSAYIRNRVQTGQAIGISYQAVDSIVDNEMQGRGVFTKLANKFSSHLEQNRSGEIVWGFPNKNAAPAWFNKLRWTKHGPVPFLFKPLRASYILRRFGINVDIPLTMLRGEHTTALTSATDDIDEIWKNFSAGLNCSIVRDRQYMSWRIFQRPDSNYRTVLAKSAGEGALVSTTVAEKHGGRIGYVMEAMGGNSLHDLLKNELGLMYSQGAEVALSWCFPWSPNYSIYRNLGFIPLPERFRPIEMNFGSRSYSNISETSDNIRSWYLSYLDSDTV